jgi:hypothetical protein
MFRQLNVVVAASPSQNWQVRATDRSHSQPPWTMFTLAVVNNVWPVSRFSDAAPLDLDELGADTQKAGRAKPKQLPFTRRRANPIDAPPIADE